MKTPWWAFETTSRRAFDGQHPRCELRELPNRQRWYVPDPAEANRVLNEVLRDKVGLTVNWRYSLPDGFLEIW